MALFMLSVHGVEGQEMPSPDQMQRMYQDVDALNRELQAEGSWVFACGLEPADTATVVHVKDGERVTVDGPFAETKEHLGGFWILRAADLDAALDLAERATVACQAPVEVRPVQDQPEDSEA
jgi:hypothetical protein